MKAIIIDTTLQILIIFPTRFYLMWYVLKAVNATELPMFIFWASIPVGLLVIILGEVAKSEAETNKKLRRWKN